MIERITDIPAHLLEWIISQFDSASTLRALIQTVGAEIQSLEDTVYSIAYERTIEQAVGAQLDQWGKLVGESRGALPDEDYRRIISARIARNNSNGTVDELLSILNTMVEPGSISHVERYPASIDFEYIDGTESANVRERVAPALRQASPAGVLVGAVVKAKTGSLRYDSGPGYDIGTYSRVV